MQSGRLWGPRGSDDDGTVQSDLLGCSDERVIELAALDAMQQLILESKQVCGVGASAAGGLSVMGSSPNSVSNGET